MSKSFLPGLAAVLALAAGAIHPAPASAQGAPAIQPKPSPALAKSLKAVQDAMIARHWPEVISKAQEVLAAPNRKPDDTFLAYFMMSKAYEAQGNRDEVRKSLQGMVDSGFLSPSQAAQYIKVLMGMSFEAKDYDAAIDYGTRLIKAQTADPEVYSVVGQSYYLKQNYGEASRFYTSLVNEQIKRGQTPREHDLKMLQSSNNKLGNKEAETDTIEKLLTYYPKPEYWEVLFYSARKLPSLQPRQELQIYRLMWATGTLKQPNDYKMFAEYATGAGLPAEAQKVFEAGLKANVFTGDDRATAERRMASVQKAAAEDRANVAKLDAEAQAAPTGELDASLGMALHSYGDQAGAIAHLQRGLSKGGMKDDLRIETQLVLGMAQLRNNDKAGALKTFQGIKTDSLTWQRIVRLWMLYAK